MPQLSLGFPTTVCSHRSTAITNTYAKHGAIHFTPAALLEIMNSNFNNQSIISCTNSQGDPVRGTLVHFTGQTAVFEVYNPYSILQLSEVLKDFRIIIRDRIIYAGKSVVSSLVNTDFMYVVQTTLVEPLESVDVLGFIRDTDLLGSEVRKFVSQWKTENNILPAYKVLIIDVKSFLDDLRSWLEQIDAAISNHYATERDAVLSDLVHHVLTPVEPLISSYFSKLETLAREIPEDDLSIHKAFTRRELHPLILCSPFIHRSYTKPLGYAGDFETINQVLGDPRQGKLLYAKLVNKYSLAMPPAAAHRNRITVLTGLLKDEAERTRNGGTPFTVLNIGCGPAKEVRNFIKASPDANRTNMVLLDFSPEALKYCREKTEALVQRRQSTFKPTFVEQSIHQLLKSSVNQSMPQHAAGDGRYHFVYCAGLFDYLTDTVCKRLISLFYSWLLPGGLLAITNIHPRNGARKFMEIVLEWNVIYRDENHLRRLAMVDGEKTVVAEPTGVNIFLLVRKPDVPATPTA